MTISKQKQKEGTAPTKAESFAQEAIKPIIATARPGLTDVESALMRRLPSNYAGRNVRDVLSYIVESEAKGSEAATATSLKKELGAAGSVVVINGKEARLTDKIDKYLVDRTKDIGGRTIQYQALEIEVSAVQQGGYF